MDPKPNPLNSVRPSLDSRAGSNNFFMQGMGSSPLGTGDMHESFKVSPRGEVTADHVTVRLPGGQSIQLKS